MNGLFAGAIILIGWFLLLSIPILIVYLIALWNVFKKAGRNGWEAIIPFYNTWALGEIAGVAWWYPLIIILSNFGLLAGTGLGLIVSLAAIVANFFVCYNLSKKFHRDTGFAVLMTLFPFVMIPIMGFSSNYQYDASVLVSENGPIDGSNMNSDKYQEGSYTEDVSGNQGMNFCSNCGKKIENRAKFCSNCGREIK